MADPTRRAILERLAAGPGTVSQVAAGFPLTLPGVSRHVRTLEEAGLVRRRVRGRAHWLSLEPGRLALAECWLAERRQSWEGSLDRLAVPLATAAPASP
ncbi:metalloregulator ArsR/SmtB family transcription factor [Myxococcota bacterium]|nr:metalloregulator ArsR/SmtB family transcription factor [Myxococcota bacterium]